MVGYVVIFVYLQFLLEFYRIFYLVNNLVNNLYYQISKVVRHNLPIDQSAVHSLISSFLVFLPVSMLATDTTTNVVKFYLITESN